MKKNIILSGIIAFTTIFCGCNNQSEKANSTKQITAAATTSVTTAKTTVAEKTTKSTTAAATEAATEPAPAVNSDSSAVVTTNSDGSFTVDFSYGCSMTFPSEWAGRVEIKDNTVYSTIMKEDENIYDGKLFSVTCYDQGLNLVGNERMLLGVSEQGYLLATVPQDVRYDMNKAEMNEEYDSLSADYESIWSTAVCSKSSPDFKPVLLSDYTKPEYVSESLYFGTWEAITYDWSEESAMDIGCIQASPYLIFCSDGTLAYQCFNNASTGTYLLNRDPSADISALGFLNGQIQQISMMQLSLSVTEMPEVQEYLQNGDLQNTTNWGFTYYSDSQNVGVDPWLE